jgi:nucleoside-diphosphate-sugar epimerase
MREKKIIAITGAQGFLADNFIKKFNDKYIFLKIIKYKKKNLFLKNKKNFFLYKNQNINNLIHFFKKKKPDLVIHLAAKTNVEHYSEEIDTLIKSNIILGSEILESMMKSGCKNIINVETSWQNFKNSKEYNPRNLYAATKEAFKKIIFFYHKAYNFNVINLKLFDTYGKNDTRNKIWNTLFKNKEINLTKGEQKINLLHISDVCDGLHKCINIISKREKLFTEYTLGSKKIHKLKFIIKKIIKINNLDIKINWGKKKYYSRQIMKPYSKYKCVPNWEQKINLQDGLKFN